MSTLGIPGYSLRPSMLDDLSTLFSYPQHNDIHMDTSIAEDIQTLFPAAYVCTLSVDGTSSRLSNFGRSCPFYLTEDRRMWCHTIAISDNFVIDLWHPEVIVRIQDYLAQLSALNPNLTLLIYNEDLEELYDI